MTNQISGEQLSEPIQWEFYSGCSPDFSGYTAAHYFTGRPDLGWCLYSRDGNGTWNQRTKEIKPLLPAHPVCIKGKWFWSYEPETRTPHVASADRGASEP